jgi:hypothetical protein
LRDSEVTEDRNANVQEASVQPDQRSRISVSKILTAAVFVACFLFSLMLGSVAVAASYGHDGTRDFIEYWAAAQQLVHGHNPYDPAGSWRLEQAAGSRFPVVMMNPPLIMCLIAPLGFLDYVNAARFWLMLQLLCFGASVWIICNLFRKQPALFILFLGVCFAPVHICILIGQIGIFLLLGIALFLALHEKRPFLAGLVLLPCAMKPHLFLPFGIVLLFWIVSRRSYRILAGFLVSLIFAAAVAHWFDPKVWADWSEYVRVTQPANSPTWNLSRVGRIMVGFDNHAWVQFMPVLAASVWACWYFWSQRDRWSWLKQGSLLLLVSVVCAPYSWLTDEALLLPCLIAGVQEAQDSGRTLFPLAVAMAVALFQFVRGDWIQTPALVWTAPAWLAFYLYATRKRKEISAAPVEAQA